jgi:hypothetical protein
VLVGLVAGAAYLITIAPYHIYTLTLTEGVNTKFLKMENSKKELLDGSFVDLANTPHLDGSEGLYSVFHFTNFLISIPVNHVVYSLIPSIKIEHKSVKLGALFLDVKNRELFSFMAEKLVPFEMTSGEQKLFLLPYFKNYINNKSNETIWKDIFSKKLSLPANTGKSFFESLGQLQKISYSDLVYNLYILYNRHLILPKDVVNLQFDENSSVGLVELDSHTPNIKLEQIFFIKNGLIYSLKIKTKILSPSSMAFRANVLRNIQLKLSSPDSAVALYAQYKNISYANRIDQKGMTYLFMAWSHDIENISYVRVIISFLERGKENLKFLQPFYTYAYKKYGTSLSNDKNLIMESASEKLKRHMSEDLEAETRKNELEKSANFEGSFASPDEKIKYYLDKSKENKKNSDDDSGILLIE